MEWKKEYLETANLIPEKELCVLSGFNVNLDRVFQAEEFLKGEDLTPKDIHKLNSWEDFLSLLNYCRNEGENREVDVVDYKPDLKGGNIFIGGQGGIVSSFASKIDRVNSVLSTNVLSKKISETLNPDILMPSFEGELNSLEKCVNSNKTKENFIFEFKGDKTGRLILSDRLEGFRPVFNLSSDGLEKLDRKVDRFFLSGFHHISEKDVEKARKQLEKIKSPVHIEYVYTDRKRSEKVVRKLLTCAESIGCDEDELEQIAEVLGIEKPESFSDHVSVLKTILEFTGAERFHLHTYDFHLCVVRQDYPVKPDKCLKSMLFGEVSAVVSAEEGRIPGSEDIRDFDFENKHIRKESFPEEMDDGIKIGEDFYVLAVPVIIHEKPKRLVGMGDLISSGAFFSEIF